MDNPKSHELAGVESPLVFIEPVTAGALNPAVISIAGLPSLRSINIPCPILPLLRSVI
ncbi:hypothetical protein [Escherichia phage PH1062]|nr:hypothetical protein [Escherichia phage PH1062]